MEVKSNALWRVYDSKFYTCFGRLEQQRYFMDELLNCIVFQKFYSVYGCNTLKQTATLLSCPFIKTYPTFLKTVVI